MTKKQFEKKIELIGKFSSKNYDNELSLYTICYDDSYIQVVYRIDSDLYDNLKDLEIEPTNKRLIKLWKLVKAVEHDRNERYKN